MFIRSTLLYVSLDGVNFKAIYLNIHIPFIISVARLSVLLGTG